MKTLNETFTDEEYEALTKAKKDYNWHDFIMLLAKLQIKKKEEKKEVST